MGVSLGRRPGPGRPDIITRPPSGASATVAARRAGSRSVAVLVSALETTKVPKPAAAGSAPHHRGADVLHQQRCRQTSPGSRAGRWAFNAPQPRPARHPIPRAASAPAVRCGQTARCCPTQGTENRGLLAPQKAGANPMPQSNATCTGHVAPDPTRQRVSSAEHWRGEGMVEEN